MLQKTMLACLLLTSPVVVTVCQKKIVLSILHSFNKKQISPSVLCACLPLWDHKATDCGDATVPNESPLRLVGKVTAFLNYSFLT
jgi:hypothetical protein